MRHAIRHSLAALSLVLSSLASSLPASAAAPAPLSQSLSGDAKVAYDSAHTLFADGDSAGALQKFGEAHRLSQDPRLLWNMAACEKELHHYARSAGLVERYLKEGEQRITQEQRQSALETRAALRAFYSILELSGAPDGAQVSVDGNAVGTLPLAEPLRVDLGTRKLRVEQPGFEAFETVLEVPGSSTIPISIALTPISAQPPAPARLSVVTTGLTDTVAIDGKVVASHAWEGLLIPGEHTLRVSAAGKKPFESHLRLSAGSTRTVQVSLESAAHGNSVWYWVAAGAVVTAGAAVGGYFLLQPRDATASQRAEGKLATLVLPLGTVRP